MKYLGVAIFLVLSSVASAQQPHIHGQDGIPDWYDPTCCSRLDCKPIADDEIEFRSDALGNPIAIYKPTQNIFEKRQWLKSQDERYHVCINRGNDASLCLYIPTGV